MSRRLRFLLTLGVFWVAAVGLATARTTLDAVTQALLVGALVAVSVPVAYLVVYRFGSDLDVPGEEGDDEWEDDWNGP